MLTPRYQSARALVDSVAQDQAVQAQIKENPVAALQNLVAPSLPDNWIYRMVVGSLGLAVLLALVGAIILSANGKAIPDVLTALGSAAVGALAGLLAPSPAAAT